MLNNNIKYFSSTICVASEGKGVCFFDLGGPLVDKETEVQVGIVSWTVECLFPEYPGVYSNVAYAKDWITEVTGI